MTLNPSRSQSTLDLYDLIYARLQRGVRHAEGLDDEAIPTPGQVAVYFVRREAQWQAATARLYRAALVYTFERVDRAGNLTEGQQLDLMRAHDLIYHRLYDEETSLRHREELRRVRRENRKKRPQTSTRKVKRFSKADASQLVSTLYGMQSRWGKVASCWFVAGSLTGLRPAEWQEARLVEEPDGRRLLVVSNAKNTNGRAHSPTRTIDVSGLKPAQWQVLMEHMKSVRLHLERGQFGKMYAECARCVRHTGKKLWPYRLKRPTLYTARHMFSADVKRSFDKAEVAALMGHASIDTAGQHYAPAWSGKGGLGVRPSEADVAAVKRLQPERFSAAVSPVPVADTPESALHQ